MFVIIFGLEINLAKVYIDEIIKSIFGKMEASFICKYISSELKGFFFGGVNILLENIQAYLHNDKDYVFQCVFRFFVCFVLFCFF